MRSVWVGTIRIGDASIPVKAYGATDPKDSGLHQLHLSDGGRIRLKRVCEMDGEEVPPAEVGRGYEMPGGEVVVLTDDDLAKLPVSSSRVIDVRAFTPAEQVDAVYFAKSYYLEPEPAGTKPYVLFSEALRESGRVAVTTVTLRQRETLGVLRVRDQVVILETMLWPDEVRVPDFPFLRQEVDIERDEQREAAALIEELSENFVPANYVDSYQTQLAALVEAKIEGNEIVVPSAAEQRAGAADLLSALRSTVEERKAQAVVPEQARKSAVRKAKSAAGKAAAARQTAEKAAGRTTAKSR